MKSLKLLLFLVTISVNLAGVSSFADTNATESSIRAKMYQQITDWSVAHGGANVTSEHIAIGYGNVLDATMTFVTADGLNCQKIGYNIAVCQNSAGQTVVLPHHR